MLVAVRRRHAAHRVRSSSLARLRDRRGRSRSPIGLRRALLARRSRSELSRAPSPARRAELETSSLPASPCRWRATARTLGLGTPAAVATRRSSAPSPVARSSVSCTSRGANRDDPRPPQVAAFGTHGQVEQAARAPARRARGVDVEPHGRPMHASASGAAGSRSACSNSVKASRPAEAQLFAMAVPAHDRPRGDPRGPGVDMPRPAPPPTASRPAPTPRPSSSLPPTPTHPNPPQPVLASTSADIRTE